MILNIQVTIIFNFLWCGVRRVTGLSLPLRKIDLETWSLVNSVRMLLRLHVALLAMRMPVIGTAVSIAKVQVVPSARNVSTFSGRVPSDAEIIVTASMMKSR